MTSVNSTTTSAASSGVAARAPLRIGEELVAVELLAHRHHPFEEAEPGGLGVLALVVAVTNDLGAGVDEEEPEDHEDPHETGDEGGPDEDEEETEGESTEDSPEQHAMLIPEWDSHRREQDRPHEDVVDAQRLLDQVAADVLTEGLVAELVGDESAEDQAACDPTGALPKSGIPGGFVIVAVAKQVDREHGGDQATSTTQVHAGNALGPGIPEVLPGFDGEEWWRHRPSVTRDGPVLANVGGVNRVSDGRDRLEPADVARFRDDPGARNGAALAVWKASPPAQDAGHHHSQVHASR